jgi:uncharacterized protein (DUF58 family)
MSLFNIFKNYFLLNYFSWINKKIFKTRFIADLEEVRLDVHRIYIIPTLQGIFLFISVIVMCGFAINFSSAVGFYFSFMMCGLFIIAIPKAFKNLVSLKVKFVSANPTFVGDYLHYDMHVTNQTKWNRYAIHVGVVPHVDGAIICTFDIASLESKKISVKVKASKRGLQFKHKFYFKTNFPYGLFSLWSYYSPSFSALVYPAIEKDGPDFEYTMGGHGENTAQDHQMSGGGDFSGIRAYVPGDSLKHLAWRQIARMDSVGVNNLYTKSFDPPLPVSRNIDFSSFSSMLSLEDKLSRMTRLVIDAEKEGCLYEVNLPNNSIALGNGYIHQSACLSALALYE